MKKEYNYIYEDGRIVRATQSTVTMSDERITSKTLDLMICYIYDENGRLTKKYTSEDDLMNVGGTFYEYDENGDTVVLYNDKYDYTGNGGDNYKGKTVISHSHNDTFGRKEFEEIKLGAGFVSRKFSYLAGEVHAAHTENDQLMFTPTTNLVSEIVMSDGHVLSYTYDAEERITSVTDTYFDSATNATVSTVTDYTYDALGQLLTETCDGVTVNTMVYDNYGNITSKNGISYAYDATWKDLLTSYNGQSITYDAQGNPNSYLGHTLTWEKGRQLKSFDTNTYTYNANGIRTSKTVGGVTHNYLLDGAKILRETWGDNTLVTLWDNEDSICGIKYNGASYYFLKNLQGDIIAITDNNGAVVARYSYDAWGACTIDNPTSADIATINPFRYRGYYYDSEIGMYYLQSRYYNPVVGRFVNADEAMIIGRSSTTLSYNLLAYCDNSPIGKCDYNGNFFLDIIRVAVRSIVANPIMLYITQNGKLQSAFNFFDFWMDNNGIYHTYPECWQRWFGYNDIYDAVFYVGTYMNREKFEFTYNGYDYIIWLWKGYYLNLGAGAELGIYKRLTVDNYKTGHWLAATDEKMKMILGLYYQGTTIFWYNPTEYQWWITGFAPQYQWFDIEHLRAHYEIYFNDIDMFDAFRKTRKVKEWQNNRKIDCVYKKKKVTITF